jgi:hypothetical protein
MVCILLCVIYEKGIVLDNHTTNKKNHTTVSAFALFIVGGNATCFDSFLGSSSGVCEYFLASELHH